MHENSTTSPVPQPVHSAGSAGSDGKVAFGPTKVAGTLDTAGRCDGAAVVREIGNAQRPNGPSRTWKPPDPTPHTATFRRAGAVSQRPAGGFKGQARCVERILTS